MNSSAKNLGKRLRQKDSVIHSKNNKNLSNKQKRQKIKASEMSNKNELVNS